jgi:inositol 2-dehydrogenase
MPNRLRVALIGAGRIGAAHARRLAAIPGCVLALVVDRNEQRATGLASELGAGASADPAAALSDPGVDAVVIATQVASHAELAEAAAAAGKPFFLEKPLAHDLAAGRRVVEAVRRHGTPGQVGFQRRYDPAYREAKRRIDAGELGRIEGFRGVGRDPAPPPLDYLLTSGDLLVDMGIHDLDSARFLVGEVERVHAVGGVLAVPELAAHGLFDTAVATLEFANGAVGTLEVALRTAYGYEIRAEVLGERGRLHIETDRRPDLVAYGEAGGAFDRPRGFEERFEQAYRLELEAFVANLRAGEPLSPDPLDAWESLRLALAAQHALSSGETVRVSGFGRADGDPRTPSRDPC